MMTWLSGLPGRSLLFRQAILGLATLAALLLTGPIALYRSGLAGLAAAGVAAGLCLAGAGLAMVVHDWLRGPAAALVALWTGMAIRTGIPLACGLAIHFAGGPLATGGCIYYLLVFYPITLTLGTALSLPTIRRR
jgi:hypothetical protein